MIISTLINNLKQVNISNYHKLFKYEVFLSNYRANDWNNFLHKNKLDLYQKNLICRDDNFEIFLINWPRGWESKIHDHAKYGCLLKVLDGALEETKFNNTLDVLDTNYLNLNQVSYLDDSIGYHKIKNPKNTNSVSLHIYSPPNHKTQYFNNI